MIIEITARNIPKAYIEGLWKFRSMAKSEETRNGEAMVLPYPVFLTIHNPEERVLNCPVRDANPFFHVMEFVWMMAGSNDVKWISQFNKRMMEYADDGILRGAYGWRWRNPKDQITRIIELLSNDPNTRQAMLSMWDPFYDGPDAKTSDRPCNTHIYFRIRASNYLDMTVCNRSNDFIWGMLGANAVHMTLLQEFIASASGYKLGKYMAFSNNCHIYTGLPKFEEIYNTINSHDIYKEKSRTTPCPFPMNIGKFSFTNFSVECKNFLDGKDVFKSDWLQYVAYPMRMAYLDRPNREEWIATIAASDWRKAARDWNKRKQKS